MTGRRLTRPPTDREVWFLTGSQDLYGAETLRQVEQQSRAIAEQFGADLPPARRARVEAGAHRLGGDPPCLPRCQR